MLSRRVVIRQLSFLVAREEKVLSIGYHNVKSRRSTMKKILTIAGSDSSGGAGIQADLKTIAAHGMYGMSVITALTAQNTTGVYGIMEATPEFVAQQLDCVFTDIYPDSVKIGMVSSGRIIEVIADKLIEYDAKNVVVDPVMVATSGSKLLSEEAMDVLVNRLLPLGTIITPNIPETQVLCGSDINIKSEEDMIKAAKHIYGRMQNTSVLVKGGHLVNDAIDILYENGNIQRFVSERIDNPNTHGTGCTLSSAIACNLAEGYSLTESISNAKAYLMGALKDGLNLGRGSGPLNHMYRIK